MRNILPILFVVVLAGCHSPSIHTQTKTVAPSVAAPPPFRPLLVTTPGTHTSSDSRWRIGVTENSVDLSHSLAHNDGAGSVLSGWSTTSPQGWKAQPGWFVFVESESRVWAYDGNRKLLLQTETVNGNHSSGTIYSSEFPAPVPVEVLARISEPTRKALKVRE